MVVYFMCYLPELGQTQKIGQKSSKKGYCDADCTQVLVKASFCLLNTSEMNLYGKNSIKCQQIPQIIFLKVKTSDPTIPNPF